MPRMKNTPSPQKIARRPIYAASLPSPAPREWVIAMSSMSAQLDSMCAIDMSGGREMGPIPNAHTRKRAFIQRTKKCRNPSILLPRCCNSRTTQRCLTGGPLRAGRLRPTARPSAPRSNRLAMKTKIIWTPAERAAEYLKRVAALTGAEQVRADSYWLRAGRRNFFVDSKFVRLISHHGKSTCFSVATDPDMPSAEVIASALLQLKSNPRLFKKWRKRQGNTFKANAKKFRGAGWLGGDET